MIEKTNYLRNIAVPTIIHRRVTITVAFTIGFVLFLTWIEERNVVLNKKSVNKTKRKKTQ